MSHARHAVELFLALGLAATPLTPLQAQSGHAGHHREPVVAAEGGEGGESSEGGEGGEGGSARTADTDVDLLVVLGQMRGHLLVAGELLALGNARQAEPHVAHPIDELYGAIEPALERRRLTPFKPRLQALLELIRTDPQASRIPAAHAEALQAIEDAAAGVPASVRLEPDTTAAVVRGLLKVAASEYAGAIADGAVVETIEYQDSRGFALVAVQRLDQALAGATPQARQLLEPMRQRLGLLKPAWPAVTPPERAVLTPEQMNARVAEI